MVYSTQGCWVFGFCPSSGILKKRNISETGSVQWTPQCYKLALSKGFNRIGVSHPLPEDGNRSSIRNVVFFSVLNIIFKYPVALTYHSGPSLSSIMQRFMYISMKLLHSIR
jgi:hypothetical protein